MLTYYQPFLLPFLHRKKYTIPAGIVQKHFLSFEDAFWMVLLSKNIPKNSVVLVPDFYCMDVVENIRLHGYMPVFYKLDDHFQITKQDLDKEIKKYNPNVIILFHACGITNKILTDREYIQQLCKNSLVIEDSVHRLINPSTTTIFDSNHIIIDSMRKVSPLSGSFMYSKGVVVIPDSLKRHIEYSYILRAHLLYILFRIVFVVGVLCNSYDLISYAHKRLLKDHDDLIGDSVYGYSGRVYTNMLHKFIDFSRIEKLKEKQIALYKKQLAPLYEKKSYWYEVVIQKEDTKCLHVYPLGLRDTSKVMQIEKALNDSRMPVWFKYPDSPWSRSRAVLFLPLGFHVSNNDILRVCSLLILSA
jgi:hypothetical protein